MSRKNTKIITTTKIQFLQKFFAVLIFLISLFFLIFTLQFSGTHLFADLLEAEPVQEPTPTQEEPLQEPTPTQEEPTEANPETTPETTFDQPLESPPPTDLPPPEGEESGSTGENNPPPEEATPEPCIPDDPKIGSASDEPVQALPKTEDSSVLKADPDTPPEVNGVEPATDASTPSSDSEKTETVAEEVPLAEPSDSENASPSPLVDEGQKSPLPPCPPVNGSEEGGSSSVPIVVEEDLNPDLVPDKNLKVDDKTDKITLADGLLIPEQNPNSQVIRESGIPLSDLTIKGRSEGEKLELNEALEVVFSVTTNEEDIEKAVLRSVMKEQTQSIKEVISQDENVIEELNNTPDKTLFQTTGQKLDEVVTSGQFQKVISEDLEDDKDAEVFLSRMLTPEKKQEILKETIAASLDSENQGVLAEDVITEIIKNDYDRFNLGSIVADRMTTDSTLQETVVDTFQTDDLSEKTASTDPLMKVMVSGNGKRAEIPLDKIHFEAGSLMMVLDLPRDFVPGVYEANVEFSNPITGAKDVVIQDFLWGVLAVNTDKDTYRPGEGGDIDFGVLDDQGKPVCDAAVSLEIITPDGLSAFPNVDNTGNCTLLDANNTLPDYRASYTFGSPGSYTLKTTATLANGKSRLSVLTVRVDRSSDFTIQRHAATRLYPVGFAPMDLRVYFNQPFLGTLTDVVPASFDLSEVVSSTEKSPKIKLSEDGQTKTITWTVEAKAGEIRTFSYLYDSPDVSPEFFTMGPIQIKSTIDSVDTDYMEQRSWQIANDEPFIDADSTSNLRINWQFNTGSGTTATDSSANGLNGTLNNMEAGDWSTDTPLTTNQNAYSLDFDGVNELVFRADSALLDFADTDDFTLSGWFNRRTFTTDDTVIAKSNGQLGTDTGYVLYIDDATDKLVLALGDGVDLYTISSVSTFTSSGWHHFAVVWDENSAAGSKIYIDGVDNSATKVGTIGNIGSLANALTFRAAAESDGGNPFDGKLDDIRLYNKVLTQSEITTLSAGNKPAGASSLALWLRADAGTTLSGSNVTSWADQSGNAYTFSQATSGNQPTKTSSAVNFNPVLNFDGTNDVLTSTGFVNDPLDVFTVVRNTDTGSNQRVFFGSGSPDAGVNHYMAQKANNTSGQASSSYYVGGVEQSVSTTNLDNEFYLHGGHLNATRNGVVSLDINGKQISTSTGTGNVPNMSNTSVGAGYTGTTLANYFQGDVAEMIVYNSTLSSTDKQKVESYLALKYGITLDQTTSGGGEAYLNSAGTTIWAADSSDVFEYDIAGIAQDDTSRLDQVKSKSVNTDEILTVGDATSQGDLDSMTWANNNGAASWTTTGAPAGYKILSRQWRTLESLGDIGTVDLEFDVADSDFDVPALQGGTGYYFVYDSDDDGIISDETPVLMKDDGTSGDDTTSDSKWTRQQAFAADAGGGGATREFTIATFVDPVPVVTDNYISINSGSGTSGAFIPGDQIIVSWNNNGDNNTGLTSITANLSGWGGSSTATMTDSTACFGISGNNLYEACYNVVAGSIDAANVNASVTACNLGGCTTTSDTSNATVDNQAPTVTTTAISVTGASGTSGAFKSGDTPVGRWNNSATGDNNADTISSVKFNLANFRSDNTNLTGSNSSNIWTASLIGGMDSQGDTNNNVTVTVTDNAGNQTVLAGANNYTVDTTLPSITGITSVSGDTTAPYYDLTDNSNTPIVFTSTDTGTGVSSCRFNPTDVAFGSMGFACASTTLCTPFIAGEGAKTVYLSCIDGAGNTVSSNTQVDYTVDGSGPSGTSITPSSTRIITNDFPSFVVADGTDTASGVDTSTRLLERKEATYSSNSCGSFGTYGAVTYAGNYPNISDTTASGSKCYQYRWSVSDNAGNSSNATTATITRVPLTTLVITGGNSQSYGTTVNPIGHTLGTALQVQATDGGTNTALADEVTVDFDIVTVPTPPTATGQSLSAASDNTDTSGHAEVSLTLGDRAGDYEVEASSSSAVISNSVTFTATEEPYFNLSTTPPTIDIELEPGVNPSQATATPTTVTTNAVSFDLNLTPDQWPTSGLNKILNWISPLGLGWTLDAGTVMAFMETLGDPDSTLVYNCTGDTCQGETQVDLGLQVGIDFTHASGVYTNTIEYKAVNITY